MSAHLRPALVLSVFTVLVWTTRIRNIWTDDSLTTSGQVGRTALSVTFTVFAVVTLVAVIRARSREPWAGLAWWVRAFAVWTTGVWVVRAIGIATADHEIGFVVVHTVLAVVSIVLAVLADRNLSRQR